MSCMGTHFITMTPAALTFLGGALTDHNPLLSLRDGEIAQDQKLLDLGKSVVLTFFNGAQH